MNTFIAFLRGINVGGNNVILMQELRELLAASGFDNVQTYIQSGNVVFQSDARSKSELASAVSRSIEQRYGFAPSVYVLTADELQLAIKNNPFAFRSDNPKAVHCYFLATPPEGDALARARLLAKESEACELLGSVFYLYAPEGVGRSKLAAGAEKALGVSATARNLRTANKVLELAAKVLS